MVERESVEDPRGIGNRSEHGAAEEWCGCICGAESHAREYAPGDAHDERKGWKERPQMFIRMSFLCDVCKVKRIPAKQRRDPWGR